MSSIVRQKVGKNVYLYESISYRNEEGKPRNKRTPIGKIDAQTGQPIYKPDYLARMAAQGTPVEVPPPAVFTEEDVRQSKIKDYGAFYLYRSISQRTGLLDALEQSQPKHWKEIFNLATYLVSSGDPFSYCEDWLENTEAMAVGCMSSQRISELLHSITSDDRMRFYSKWSAIRSEQEYFALDITSSSSYSKLIDSVEWGYNRDGEKLPQINISMLMGCKSRLPIYQSIYSGSLKDVSTLENTLETFSAFSGGKKILLVMDKGFFSARNVNNMLCDKHHMEFLIAVPFTSKFAKQQIISERKDIDTIENTLLIGSDTLRAVTKLRSWNTNHRVYTHIYFNPKKANGIREGLYTHVTRLKEQAMKRPEKCINDNEYTKYLSIRHSEKSDSGYTINIRKEVIEAELETAGWMVLISNSVASALEAIQIYRGKDVVEKGFMKLKNCLDIARLRVHGEMAMQNKVFIGFIALILLSAIHDAMLTHNLYQSMTLKKMLLTLTKIRVHYINGSRILSPISKQQKSIFEMLGLDLPL